MDLLSRRDAEPMGGGPFLRHDGDGGSRVHHHVALGWGGLPFLPLAGSGPGRLHYHFWETDPI